MVSLAPYLIYAVMSQANPPEVPRSLYRVNEEATCIDRSGTSFNMSEMELALSNIKAIGRKYYTISGNNIVIGDAPHQRIGILIYDARFLVGARARHGLVLFHAALRGQPYIYWIEKTEDGLSRNGLLGITGSRVSLACEGTISR